MWYVTEKSYSVKKEREQGFLVLHFPLRKENTWQSKEIKPDTSVVSHQPDLKSKRNTEVLFCRQWLACLFFLLVKTHLIYATIAEQNNQTEPFHQQ